MNEPRPPSAPGTVHGQQPNVVPRPAGAPQLRPIGQAGVQPQRPVQQGVPMAHRAAPPAAPKPADDGEMIDLAELEDEEPQGQRAAGAVPAVQAASSASTISPVSKIKLSGSGDKHNYTRFKRSTHVAGTGACRLKTFHGRLSDEGLAFMDDKINEWLDNHPEVEIKLVNTVIGPLESKHNEQAMFVTIWY